jgi:hypothetical protein
MSSDKKSDKSKESDEPKALQKSKQPENKKKRKKESETVKFKPGFWKSVVKYPTKHGNWSEITESTRYKVKSCDEFINLQCEVMEEMLEHMGCNTKLSKQAVDSLRLAMESSVANQE